MVESNIDDLRKECVKMSEFDHPNVLMLIGVCLDGGPAPYIIMPFMENGSLLSYLKKERENLVLEPGTDEDVVRKISCRIKSKLTAGIISLKQGPCTCSYYIPEIM